MNFLNNKKHNEMCKWYSSEIGILSTCEYFILAITSSIQLY